MAYPTLAEVEEKLRTIQGQVRSLQQDYHVEDSRHFEPGADSSVNVATMDVDLTAVGSSEPLSARVRFDHDEGFETWSALPSACRPVCPPVDAFTTCSLSVQTEEDVVCQTDLQRLLLDAGQRCARETARQTADILKEQYQKKIQTLEDMLREREHR